MCGTIGVALVIISIAVRVAALYLSPQVLALWLVLLVTGALLLTKVAEWTGIAGGLLIASGLPALLHYYNGDDGSYWRLAEAAMLIGFGFALRMRSRKTRQQELGLRQGLAR